jgi:hypothetical protein
MGKALPCHYMLIRVGMETNVSKSPGSPGLARVIRPAFCRPETVAMGVTLGWTRYYRGQRELFGGHNDMREVTFKDFATVARKRSHTAESLAERFRGKIENPSEFFERVMTCRYHGEDRSDVVIPYRSVPEFHNEELHYFRDSNQKHRQCACGCGLPVFDCKKWAFPGCRQKIARGEVTDVQKGVPST